MAREEFEDMAVSDEAQLARIKAEVAGSSLYNEDLAPTGPEERTWTTYNIAALWIGMAIVITTYTLAAGLMAAGMNWWQALLTISLGNLIVLIPMLLNAHAGTKYGVPFPVFVRSSFGVRGANFAAIARALVACGWFGIQTWIGGLALDALLTTLYGGWTGVPGHQFITFSIFWAIQVALFFLAFLPQFVDPWPGPVWSQVLVLGSTLALLGLITDGLYALAGGTAGDWLRRRGAGFRRRQRYISGSVYLALGTTAAVSGTGKD